MKTRSRKREKQDGKEDSHFDREIRMQVMIEEKEIYE